MRAESVVRRMFALKGVAGFDQLRDDELLSIGASLSERRYRPGQQVIAAGSALWHLFIVRSGRLMEQGSGRAQTQVVGADLLLSGRPAAQTLIADRASGAVCLRLSKGHFLTVVRECPDVLVEMMPRSAVGRP